MNLEQLARILIGLAVVLGLAGIIIYALSRGLGIGRLPGDVVIRRDGFTCFFPIATAIIVSVILTILLNLVIWLIRRF